MSTKGVEISPLRAWAMRSVRVFTGELEIKRWIDRYRRPPGQPA